MGCSSGITTGPFLFLRPCGCGPPRDRRCPLPRAVAELRPSITAVKLPPPSGSPTPRVPSSSISLVPDKTANSGRNPGVGHGGQGEDEDAQTRGPENQPALSHLCLRWARLLRSAHPTPACPGGSLSSTALQRRSALGPTRMTPPGCGSPRSTSGFPRSTPPTSRSAGRSRSRSPDSRSRNVELDHRASARALVDLRRVGPPKMSRDLRSLSAMP